MTESSLTETQSNTRLGNLALSTVTALGLQISGAALTYLVQVFLARWMGQTEYGIYEYAISWSLLLAIPAGLGLPRAALRFISEYRVKQEWGLLRGLILSSWQMTVAMGVLMCLGGEGIITLLNNYHSNVYSSVLLVGIWLVPLQALIQLHEDMGRGADSITLAYGPSKVLWPILVLAAGFFLIQKNHTLTSLPMTGAAIGTLAIVVLFQFWSIWQRFDRDIIPTDPIYNRRQWLGVALPLLLQRAFQTILAQVDILMVGFLLEPGSVAIYSAAVKTALWVTFVLQSINVVAAPAFATLHVSDDRANLQKIVSATALWIFWPSLTISLGLIVFAQPILSLFGSEFAAGHWELKIVVVGQLVNALCGSVSNLLAMTGYQNKTVMVAGYCVLLNLVGNAIAIPLFGTVGAAMTTALTIILRNLWLSFFVVKHLGVYPSVFYSLFRPKNNLEFPSQDS